MESTKPLTDYINGKVVKLHDKREASKSFTMSSFYQKKYHEPSITINDAKIINMCEILVLVALPGTGKTQICETFASAYIASNYNLSECDCFGIEINIPDGKRCLYVDTERPDDDNFDSFDRICRRVDIKRNRQTFDSERGVFYDLDYQCFSKFSSVEQFKNELERLILENTYGFLIIDGILDFVPSMNDEEKTSECVRWLRAMAHQYELSIIVTMHPNKGTDAMAGHLGGFLYRYSRACLLLKPHDSDKEIKVLTHQFSQGKMSHGGSVDVAFRWSDDLGMMVSCEMPETDMRIVFSRKDFELIFREVFLSGKKELPAFDLRNRYAASIGKSGELAKKHIAAAVSAGVLLKGGNGKSTIYSLNPVQSTEFG